MRPLIHKLRWWKFRRSYRQQFKPLHPSLEIRPESHLGRKMVLGKDA